MLSTHLDCIGTRRRLARAPAELLLLAAIGCYQSAGGSDAASEDATADDGSVPGTLRIEIVNRSSDRNAFLDACPHCNEAWQLRRTDGAGEELTLPGLLTCRCTSCDATACSGMSDGPYSWIELPPGATLALDWDGRRYDFSAGGCASTGSGCWAPAAAPAGTYEVRVAYSLSTETSAARSCPAGGVPWDLQPYRDAGTIARCERTCAGAGCPALALDAIATATFAWPATGTVRVELGGG